jgi:hypothetical protein
MYLDIVEGWDTHGSELGFSLESYDHFSQNAVLKKNNSLNAVYSDTILFNNQILDLYCNTK